MIKNQSLTLSFKLILLGNSNTGKSSIINQYINHVFQNCHPTVGIDFFTHVFHIDDFVVKLSIFDTAGQQRYSSLSSSYYKGADAAIFTYSLIQKQTFQNIPKWISKFQQNSGLEALRILVGTKKDLLEDETFILNNKQTVNKLSQLDQKQDLYDKQKQKDKITKSSQSLKTKQEANTSKRPSKQQINRMVTQFSMIFSFQCSSKTNQNISQIFQEICRYLLVNEMKKRGQRKYIHQEEYENILNKKYVVNSSQHNQLQGKIRLGQQSTKQQKHCC